MIGIGVIGLGVMGRIHLANLLRHPDRVEIVAVFDPNSETSNYVSATTGAKIAESAEELISDEDVAAVIIASPANLHWPQVRKAIELGKPVFVEKPLVTSKGDEQEIRSLFGTPAEKLVWVGFMRRFDPAYLALKEKLDSGILGQPIFAEMSHRNPAVPDSFDDAAYMLETFVHECDVSAWLFDNRLASVQVDGLGPIAPGTSRHDPKFLTLQTDSGVVIRVSGHITNGYGYEIRCEVVGNSGQLSLDDSLWQQGGAPTGNHAANWGARFALAYQNIIDSWLNDLEQNSHRGAGLESGLEASRAAWALMAALEQPGKPQAIEPLG